jgi:uncharacterized protein YndB with AHSA1/START domain
MTVKAQVKPSASRELTITRVIDAPREAVFEAWTDPKQMARWWGPNGFANPVCEWTPGQGRPFASSCARPTAWTTR